MKNTKALATTLLIAMFCTCSLYAQQLNNQEKQIADLVDANNAASVQLLERIVNTESPTENLAGVRAVGSLIIPELKAMGFETRWIQMPAETKRAGHLVAELKGSKGKRLLLLGHLDTVLRGEKFRREGDRGFGTGIGDMHGGNVIALSALTALHAAGALTDRRIIVMFTGDEEDSCEPVSLCRGDMIEAAKRSDAVLSFEGTVRNTATVGRRGASSWTLTVEAKTGHSGQIFSQSMGNGAIFEASRILDEFRRELSNIKYLTFNPALIAGGTTTSVSDSEGSASGKTNVVPAKVVVNGDLRFISEEQKQSARAKIKEIVARNLSGTTAMIKFFDGIPAMTPVEGNYELLRTLDRASQDLGLGPVEALDPGERGAGDVAFVADLLPALDGIGIGGGQNSHARGESADLSTMPKLTKRAALLMYRLTR